MKPALRKHKQYRRMAIRSLNKFYKAWNDLEPKIKAICNKFLDLDLSAADTLLASRYSNRGPMPRQPSDMLRSLLLSIEFDVPSITDWAAQLKITPLYAILSGFDPDNTPGVGTFYDFINRLWLASEDNLTPFIRQPRSSVKPPAKKGEKASSADGVTAESLFASYSKTMPDDIQPYSLLLALFKTIFLNKSVSLGLISQNALSLSGDGTPLRTAAKCRSHRVSSEQDCVLRRYSQPDCDYGWDSYRNCLYFGYGMYLFTDSDSKSNLPVFPLLLPASMHDSIAFVHAFMHMRTALPDYTVSKLLLDSAHDNMATYVYCNEQGITPFIDLNMRGAKTFVENGITFDSDGRPYCMAGHKMVRDGTEKTRKRIKYRCTHAWSDINKCPLAQQCCKTAYGKVIHTATKDNPRIFTMPPRDSKEFRSNYAKRTSAERDNKQFKVDRKLEAGRHRSTKCWYCRIYLISMCIHLDSWPAAA